MSVCARVCVQGLYGSYLKNSKFVSEVTAPSVALMGNCIVDLYGIRPSVSYQFAFVYIRYELGYPSTHFLDPPHARTRTVHALAVCPRSQ